MATDGLDEEFDENMEAEDGLTDAVDREESADVEEISEVASFETAATTEDVSPAEAILPTNIVESPAVAETPETAEPVVTPQPPTPVVSAEDIFAQVEDAPAQIEFTSSEVTPTEDDLQIVRDANEVAADAFTSAAPTMAAAATASTAIESDEETKSIKDKHARLHERYQSRAFKTRPIPKDDKPSRGGWWSIPALCAGLAIVACCLIIPQADANRRLAWERVKLTRDLESIQRQADVNGTFLGRLSDDPNLAERLAQRQMKLFRQGTAVLDLPHSRKNEMSPFLLTAVVPPAAMAPYQPRGGILSALFINPRYSLYLSGVGLMLMAVGLVMGGETVANVTTDDSEGTPGNVV